MTLTNYIGKVLDGQVLVICQDSNGEMIQCPTVELFTKKGFKLLPISEGQEPKSPYKRLTELEVAQFFKG